MRAQVAPLSQGYDVTLLEHQLTYAMGDDVLYAARSGTSWGPHFGTLVYRRALVRGGSWR